MEHIKNKLHERDLYSRYLLARGCRHCGHFSWQDVLFHAGRTTEQIDWIERRPICSKCGNRRDNRLQPAEGNLAPNHN